MELTIAQYLLICPLVFLGGVMDAIAGGGGLISLPAYLLSGIPVHLAMGTNKLSAVFGASVSAWRYTKKGYTPGKISAFCVGIALLGSGLGARLALRIDDRYFRFIMLALLPVTAFYVLKKKAFDDTKPPLPERRTILVCMAISLGVGVYDGFYGPGSGTFLLILLTSVAHLKLKNANGVAKIINWTTNITAVAVYVFSGNVCFPLGVTAGMFNIMGSYLGTICFEKGGAKIVKPAMLAVMVLFFIKVLTEQGII